MSDTREPQLSNNADVMPGSGEYNSQRAGPVCEPAETSTVGEYREPFPNFGAHCLVCGDYIEEDDLSVEEFEETGELVCLNCAEARAEERDEDNGQFGVGA